MRVIRNKPNKWKSYYSVTPKYFKGMGDDFYRTIEWRNLRSNVLSKSDKKCVHCEASYLTLQVDHILPRCRFPDLELKYSNLQVLCVDCNKKKGSMTYDEFCRVNPKFVRTVNAPIHVVKKLLNTRSKKVFNKCYLNRS